jgi:LacI family transcriptional regulator
VIERMNRPTPAPRVTLKQIAEAAGVHPATVSRALNPESSTMISEETRDLVLAKAAELGYQPNIPARTLRDGRSETVGIVVANLENPYTGRIIRGVENALEGRGVMALVAETQDDVDRMGRVVGHLLSRSVDGIICTGARLGTERLLRKAYEQVPIVLVDRTIAGTSLPTVAPDDVIGGMIAAEHLLELGHRRLAQIAGSADISSFERRVEGFTKAVADGGGEIVGSDERAAEPSVEEGYRLMGRLLDGPARPTGVFAHNDLMALGVIAALRDRGVECPGEVSVVGYDDLPVTEFTSPPLTTVHLPGYQLGRMAADVVVAMADDPHHQPSDLTVTPRITVRGSTDAPPP